MPSFNKTYKLPFKFNIPTDTQSYLQKKSLFERFIKFIKRYLYIVLKGQKNLEIFNIQSKHKKGIATKQAIKIATLRRENPNLSINEIVETVLKIKAIDAPHHMIVCEVNEKLGNFIKSNDDHAEKLLEILRKNINGEFFELDANEIIISIKMDETAFKTFHEQQSNEGVQFTEFLNGFLEDKLG